MLPTFYIRFNRKLNYVFKYKTHSLTLTKFVDFPIDNRDQNLEDLKIDTSCEVS